MKKYIIGTFLLAIITASIIRTITSKVTRKSDYQIEISLKGTTIYDGNRKVGFLRRCNSQLDSLIINDNQ